MAFCTSCGTRLSPSDKFCAGCGAPQVPFESAGIPGTKPAAASDPLRSISPRTASILCYVPLVGWIMSVVVLASPLYARDRTLRFHAFQGIYLFVAWLLVDWVLAPMFGWVPYPSGRLLRFTAHVLQLAVFAAWVWMLVKTSQNQFYSLPFIGELAERSVAEQR